MKNNFLKGKGRSNRLISLISVVAIVLIFAFNLILTYVAQQNTIFVDTSFEGLYTLSDMLKEECSFIDDLDTNGRKVNITFCSDPDTLIANQITRVIYFMSLQMANYYDNVEVDTVNIVYNPTAVSKYKPTSMTEIVPTDIIVSYGDRYRVVNSNSFWTASNNVVGSYCGEYKMASLIMSVTAVNRPKAYFVTDHGETYYDADNPDRAQNVDAAYLYDLITERGLEVKTLNLSSVEEIPSDCVLLIINNPTIDFTVDKDSLDDYDYVSETEKLDRYLIGNYGSILVAKDYEISLPVFEDFLYEWGFDLGTAQVKDEGAHITNEDGTHTTIIADYDKSEDSYGYAIYGDLVKLNSTPSMVFDDAGYIKCSYGKYFASNEQGTFSISRNYAPFLYSSGDAVAYEKNELGEYVSPVEEGALHLAGVTTRLELNEHTGEYKYSYLFCANSGTFFSNDLLGNASLANYEVMSALTENVIRSDEYASIDLGSTSANSANRGGKVLLDTSMSQTDFYEEGVFLYKGLSPKAVTVYTVIIMLIPVIVAACGIAVRIRRKFL